MEKILGIHINAPSKVGRAITHARKHAGRYFGSQEFFPHITFYLARYSASTFRMLVKQLTEKPPLRCEVTIGGLTVDSLASGKKFLGLTVRRTSGLMNQHRVLVQRANLLRRGLLRSKDRIRIERGEYSSAEKERILKYGYSRVMSEFHPHFTIGTLDRHPTSVTSEKSIRQRLKSIQGYKWIPKQMIVGLYEYDTKRERYTRHRKENMVQLQEPKKARRKRR